jgi:hypothetical protein
LAHKILKYSGKTVYRVIVLATDDNTKRQKSKNLPGQSKIYEVLYNYNVGNCKNRSGRASTAIIINF